MTMKPSLRLAELEIDLPKAATPLAAYVPAIIDRGVIRTSGQLPMEDGELTCSGPVGRDGADVEDAQDAAAVCAINALAAASALAGGTDNLTGVVKVTGFVASLPDFTGQPQVVDGASQLFQQIFGSQHIRSAVGVASLPLGASVEIEVEFSLRTEQDSTDSPARVDAAPTNQMRFPLVDIHADMDARRERKQGGCGCGGERHPAADTFDKAHAHESKGSSCCGGHSGKRKGTSLPASLKTQEPQASHAKVVDLNSKASSDATSAIKSAVDALQPGDSVVFVDREEPLVMFDYLETLDSHFHVQRLSSEGEEFRFLVTRKS